MGTRRKKRAGGSRPRKKGARRPLPRKRRAGRREPKQRKKPAPAPRRKRAKKPKAQPRKKRRGHVRKTRDWRSNPSTRSSILKALKGIAGSLVDRLKRAPLNSQETVYLRGIANRKAGKRVTPAQALALLAASRPGSTLFKSVFGKREAKLVASFLAAANKTAVARSLTPGALLKYTNLPPGLAMQLISAQQAGKKIFYKRAGGPVQVWSIDGFRRFITNPIYKARREAVLGGGTFWVARGTRSGGLPKKGRTKLVVH